MRWYRADKVSLMAFSVVVAVCVPAGTVVVVLLMTLGPCGARPGPGRPAAQTESGAVFPASGRRGGSQNAPSGATEQAGPRALIIVRRRG